MSEVERLVAQYGDLLLRVCINCLKSVDDAEDVCQTVFLKLLTKKPVFESAEHEKAWILHVALNECYAIFRRRKRLLPLDEARAKTTDPPRHGIMDAVAALPPKYRDAVFLVYCEGYNSAEAGKILGCSESAVWSRLEKKKKMLMEVQNEYADD